MKKTLVLMLTLSLTMALAACSGPGFTPASSPASSSSTQEDLPASSTPELDELPAVTTFTVERCNFSDTVHAADNEYIGSLYDVQADQVYVDVVLRPSDPYGNFSPDNFRAYTMYEGQCYHFQYCVENTTATGVSRSADAGKFVPRLHLFTLLPNTAETTGTLAVTCIINGEEMVLPVYQKPAPVTLENKIQVKPGDKYALFDNLVEFEVIDCKYAETLSARDAANSEQYTFNNPFMDVTLKVTNNTDQALWDIIPYTILGEEIHRGNGQVENDAGTAIEPSAPLQPGQTKYIHLIQTLSEEQLAQDTTMRFNLLGNCYYCVATSTVPSDASTSN